jgi:hypothetical protein
MAAAVGACGATALSILNPVSAYASNPNTSGPIGSTGCRVQAYVPRLVDNNEAIAGRGRLTCDHNTSMLVTVDIQKYANGQWQSTGVAESTVLYSNLANGPTDDTTYLGCAGLSGAHKYKTVVSAGNVVVGSDQVSLTCS